VIFCLPAQLSVNWRLVRPVGALTISAWLDGGFDVANALNGDTVLVVTVDELVLELSDLVDEYTELVGDIRDVVVASLTPDGKLLLHDGLVTK